MAAQGSKNYQQLKAELDKVMEWFENKTDDLDVDQAITQYEKGMKLVGELEKQLKQAENKLKKVKDFRKAG